MRLFYKGKDGGAESTVTGYWLCEFKRLFSIMLLRFDHGSRDAYHSHAFNSVSWVLWGVLSEYLLHADGGLGSIRMYWPGPFPIVTRRSTFHMVKSSGTTWVLSFRGPWARTWHEYRPGQGHVTLADGRRELDS